MDESSEDLLLACIVDIREKIFSNAKEILVPFPLKIEFDQITFRVPLRGDKKKLLELSQRNAKYFRLEKVKQSVIKSPVMREERKLQTIQKDLRLPILPVTIECFDNSNLQGTNPVAACIVFRNARPVKREYRHYNIKTVEGPNDFASMEEVVFRRYRRLVEEKKELPQLIVIDGGKGQLSFAVRALERLNLKGKIAVIGIAKRLEEIYFPGDPVPLYINKNSETLKVIQQLRDEAHRFGITFHRQKRSKSLITSQLNQIRGIGEKTIQLLLKEFRAVERIKNTDYKELKKIIGESKANLVYQYFHKKQDAGTGK
jgi:excinuclease ABC subunit C